MLRTAQLCTDSVEPARPVVASAVGGIQDQIVDGEHGLLVANPRDLDAFAATLGRVLADSALAGRLGTCGRERVRGSFLGDTHLTRYIELFAQLLQDTRRGATAALREHARVPGALPAQAGSPRAR